jgi:hypothetical protein
MVTERVRLFVDAALAEQWLAQIPAADLYSASAEQQA